MKTSVSQKQNQARELPDDTAQLIQIRAYERYLERGQEPGHELEDWLKAEQDIRERGGTQQIR